MATDSAQWTCLDAPTWGLPRRCRPSSVSRRLQATTRSIYYEATAKLLRGYYEATTRSTTRLLRGYYEATTRLLRGYYEATNYTRLLRGYYEATTRLLTGAARAPLGQQHRSSSSVRLPAPLNPAARSRHLLIFYLSSLFFFR